MKAAPASPPSFVLPSYLGKFSHAVNNKFAITGRFDFLMCNFWVSPLIPPEPRWGRPFSKKLKIIDDGRPHVRSNSGPRKMRAQYIRVNLYMMYYRRD